MKLSNSLIIGAIALTTSSAAIAADQTDYDIFNQQFLEAINTRESGDIFASIEMLEQLIETQPEYKRAQLELAVAYFRATLFTQAKAHAQEVLADPNTPAEVKETIDIFLGQLADIETAENENRHTYEGSVAVGIGKDSNINASPADNIIDINGIQFTLNPGSIAQEANYGTINVQMSHTYRMPGTAGIGSRPVKKEWNTSVALSRKAYQDIGDYNLDVATIQTGIGLISSTNWRAGLNLRLDHISLGDEQLGLFKGINGNYTIVDDASSYTVTAEMTDQDFNSSANDGRDGLRLGLGTEMQQQFNQELLGSIGVNLARNDAKDDNKQYVSKAINTALYYAVNPATLVYGQVGYKVVDYNGVEPVYAVTRNDSEVSATVGATYNFKTPSLGDLKLNGKISRYNNTSDVSIYEYERTDAMVELSKNF